MTNKPKPWKSIDEQLTLLQQRGMQIDNPSAAKSYLERLGYYRLSGYWYPFRVINSAYSPGRRGLSVPISLSKAATLQML